jgi:WD40 repeat protein
MDPTGRTVQVWNSETELVVWTFKHPSDVNATTFSPDSKRILSASDDKTVQVHSIADLLSDMEERPGFRLPGVDWSFKALGIWGH